MPLTLYLYWKIMKKESIEFLQNFKGLQIFVTCDERGNKVPWHFHCSFEEAHPKLIDKQKEYWGAYFVVNELDKNLDPERKRTKKMLKSIRAIFCDYDNKTELPKFPIKPSITVESSPGKYQFYWLTTTDNIEEWEKVQETIVKNYGGDKQAKDLTRYLRIPGFYHCKKDPIEVKLIDNNGKVYDWEVVKIAFPPTEKSSTTIDNLSEKIHSDASSKTIKDHDADIIFGQHFHGPVLAHLQRLKDGDPPYVISAHLKNLFELAQNFKDKWAKTDAEWEHAYSTIDYQISEYTKILGIKKTVKPIDKKAHLIPEFPVDAMSSWPDPWPKIWQNYKRIPRTLDECLLFPTVICIHSFVLNAVYVTEWNKRPNMAFLNIAPSTGNKDVNSENVIRSVLEIIVKSGKISNPFMKMVMGAEGITSDTAFLQSFNDNDLFWVNTESTHLFQQMAQAGMSNSSVKALESKIIDVVDGGPIRGKRKAGKDGVVSGIDDPNAQILLYAQPETISAYIKENMVDSGLLGRMILHIPTVSGDDPFLDSFKRKESKAHTMDANLIDFYCKIDAKSMKKYTLKPSDKDLEFLQDWMMSEVKPLSDGDHSIKMLKRLAISAEQLYVIILGICRKWDEFHNKAPRDSIDVKCMIPILEYWAKCKIFVLKEYIDRSVDPLSDAIVEIIADLISGRLKAQKVDAFGRDHNATRKSNIYLAVKNRTRLKQELNARGDTRNVRERVYKIIDLLVKENILVEIKNINVSYIGLGEDSDGYNF